MHQLTHLNERVTQIQLLSTNQNQAQSMIKDLHSVLISSESYSLCGSMSLRPGEHANIEQEPIPEHLDDSTDSTGRRPRFSTMSVKTSLYWGSPCRPGCCCSCHKRQHFQSPSFLNQLIGTLFVGYSGIPILTPECNEYSCQRRATPSTQIAYCFPTWFWKRQLSLSILFTPLDGPIMSLKFPRLVSPSSKIFDYAFTGNVAGMKVLFQQGLASPNDVRFDCSVSALQVSE